jgi:hypothetical protein
LLQNFFEIDKILNINIDVSIGKLKEDNDDSSEISIDWMVTYLIN